MLQKCCTQYASKFGKLSSGHRIGRGQFSFKSQRRAMPKNAQTTTQLHSFHMRARSCSKPSKQNFNSTWTKNFQMYKLDLEKTEEPEMKLPTSTGSQKKQQKKIYFCFTDYAKAFTVCITTNCGKFLKWVPDHLTCFLTNLYAGQEATVRAKYGTRTGLKLEKECVKAIYCHPDYLIYMQSISCKMLGWMKYKLESRLLG